MILSIELIDQTLSRDLSAIFLNFIVRYQAILDNSVSYQLKFELPERLFWSVSATASHSIQ